MCRGGLRLGLTELPPDDPATLRIIARADTVRVWRHESRGTMATMLRMVPVRW